ncbi:MAG TPA: lamin tail domain-containing protein [Polyangiaceae bacterium]|nr:lamin tail domain-containing protein [Polyangiaceae bacterium]
MRRKASLFHWVSACAALGCAPEARERPPAALVVVEPEAPLEAVPPVVRFRVEGFSGVSASLLLFSGELGSYYLGRIRAGDLPSTLAERRVTAEVFPSEDGEDAIVAPSAPLDSGAVYSLAALGGSRLAVATVTRVESPYAERVWPPRGAAGGRRAVYCSEASIAVPRGEVRLSPGDVPVASLPGADGAETFADRCFRLEGMLVTGGPPLVPPPVHEAVQVDPSPLPSQASEPTEGIACVAPERSLGPGCLLVDDDRAVLRGPEDPLFWIVQVADAPPRIVRTSRTEHALLDGLSADTVVRARGTVTDLAGNETPFDESFRTAPPRPHLILSEVLANPAGPEPSGEWVEVENDGASPVNVGGFTLSDGGGETTLPSAVMAPGEYALVVGDGYAVDSPDDVPPAAGTLLLRVPRVGTDGLSNGGEALTLSGKDGRPLSRFPRIAASRPGVSVARRTASALDDDASAFGTSSAPGASPGWENHIDSPF